MNRICFIYILLFSFLFYSCESDLITVVDEYDHPYNITPVPKNGSITVSFISGISASDFVGFNFYVNITGDNFTQPDDAVLNTNNVLPSVNRGTHSRALLNITVPGVYTNGVPYYVTLTAYGTNSLATGGFIETSIDSIYKVVPRPEGNITFLAQDTTLNIPQAGDVIERSTDTVTGLSGIRGVTSYKTQYFGNQTVTNNINNLTGFDNIVIVTNNNYNTDFDTNIEPITLNGLYILYNNTSFVKLWIESINAAGDINFKWAFSQDASLWNGI